MKDIKAILRAYQPALRYCVKCFDELGRERNTVLKSPKLDGMPRNGGGGGLEDQIVKIDELERRAARSREKAIDILDTVERMEEVLEDFSRKSVIRLRYIQGLSWEGVAAEMGYSERRVYMIHGEALRELRSKEHEIFNTSAGRDDGGQGVD